MPTGEVSTHDIAVHAMSLGKKIFVPYIRKSEQGPDHQAAPVMEMLALHSREDLESLRRDGWGIPSLDKNSIAGRENAFCGSGVCKGVDDDEHDSDKSEGLDLILLPGVAFDLENRRLGHGKGYYDHYLQRYMNFVSRRRAKVGMPYLGGNSFHSLQPLADSRRVVGLALTEQMLPYGDAVPSGVDDWRVDHIISGSEG